MFICYIIITFNITYYFIQKELNSKFSQCVSPDLIMQHGKPYDAIPIQCISLFLCRYKIINIASSM